MNFFRGNTQGAGEGFAHLRKMRAKFGLFGDDHGVYMLNGKGLFLQELSGVLQEHHAVSALPLRIGIGEVRSDVAEASGAKESVAQGVSQNIAVGMTDRAFVERKLDAANNELAPRLQPMQIVSNAAA